MTRPQPARRDSLLAQRDTLLAQRDAIYGVDFSGAKDAERRIWIAHGVPKGGGLCIEACKPLSRWRPEAHGPEQAAQALAEFIQQHPSAAFALDFPFGLPRALLAPRTGWPGFLRSFRKTHASPEAFREFCRKSGAPGESRRATDALAHTPFCPYNLRIYRQTYFGIAHTLAPLVEQDVACAPPMQTLRAGKAWLMEICPASTLKAMGLYRRFPKYKQVGEASRRSRSGILAAVSAQGQLTLSHSLKQAILDDAGGDALDSVVAAFTAFKLLWAPHLPEVPPAHRRAALREAWVYCWPHALADT